LSLLLRAWLPEAVREKPEEEPLAGGGSTHVVRHGEVVLRERRPWSPTVVGLLLHLHHEGLDRAPQPVGDGFAADGREQLEYIHASSAPQVWSEEGCYQLGMLLRDVHRLAVGYLPRDPIWMPWWGRALSGPDRLLGHGDVAPWNLLSRDGLPVALLDWDTAGPMSGAWDLAQAVWLNAQLHDDDVAEHQGLPDASHRALLARAMCDGYQLATVGRAGLVDRMIEVAVRTSAQEAIDAGVTRAGQEPRPMGLLGGGPPFTGQNLLWAITWRTRSARWMLANRQQLDRALR
jgi:Phosphotransferase enzyme family